MLLEKLKMRQYFPFFKLSHLSHFVLILTKHSRTRLSHFSVTTLLNNSSFELENYGTKILDQFLIEKSVTTLLSQCLPTDLKIKQNSRLYSHENSRA